MNLAQSHIAKMDEQIGDHPFLKRAIAARRRQGLPNLIPDVAYAPVTELTIQQTVELRKINCPIKNHSHTLRLVWTGQRPEDGQLFSWLACDQGATYRWELIHGLTSTRENCPHWGWSRHHDELPDWLEEVKL